MESEAETYETLRRSETLGLLGTTPQVDGALQRVWRHETCAWA
jgi:hypothetical protein